MTLIKLPEIQTAQQIIR